METIDNDFSHTDDSKINIDKLTNKKKEYLKESILDKNGQYSYLENPSEYKKARKRL